MSKKHQRVTISRGVRPASEDDARRMIVNLLKGSIGIDPTLISQQMMLNATNYHWLTSIADTSKASETNQKVLHKTVKELNGFCRRNKFPLGLLIMPHTSTSDYSGDEVIAIPWDNVRQNPTSESAVNSLFETVTADGYPHFVDDAKTTDSSVEGSDVL